MGPIHTPCRRRASCTQLHSTRLYPSSKGVPGRLSQWSKTHRGRPVHWPADAMLTRSRELRVTSTKIKSVPSRGFFSKKMCCSLLLGLSDKQHLLVCIDSHIGTLRVLDCSTKTCAPRSHPNQTSPSSSLESIFALPALDFVAQLFGQWFRDEIHTIVLVMRLGETRLARRAYNGLSVRDHRNTYNEVTLGVLVT